MSTPLWGILLLAGVSAGILYVGIHLDIWALSGAFVTAIVLALVLASMGWTWTTPLVVYLGSQLYVCCLGQHSPEKRQANQPLRGTNMAARLSWPAVMAAAQIFEPESALYPAFVGALAVAAADVWATQIGLLSKDRPRLLTSRIPVPHGTPGAISTLGLVASLGGAWLIGLVSLLTSALPELAAAQGWPSDHMWIPLAATMGGFIGMLADSALAQTVQAMYYCEMCNKLGQQETDAQGHKSRHVRGIRWMNDDSIDLISAILGALVTALCLKMLS